MASSTDTFGTFLQTYKQLKRSRPDQTETDLHDMVVELQKRGGSVAVADLMNQSSDKSAFMTVLQLGRQQGLIRLDEDAPEPMLALTTLGRVYLTPSA